MMSQVNYVGYIQEIHIGVAADECHLFGAL